MTPEHPDEFINGVLCEYEKLYMDGGSGASGIIGTSK